MEEEPVLVERLERSIVVSVKMDERLVERLDRLAARLGCTRSDIIRAGAELLADLLEVILRETGGRGSGHGEA